MRADESPTSFPPPLPSSEPTPVVPLDYSPRDRDTADRGPRVIRFLRRLCIAAGVAFILGAIMTINFPFHDEEVVLMSIGVGLVLLAIPLPKMPGW